MIYMIVILLWVALDQYSKYLVRTGMSLGETIPLLEDIFHLTYVNNYGAAFGIFQGKQVFLIIFTLIALVGIAVYLFTQRKKLNWYLLLAMALVVGGGIGNLIDRIVFGYVVDFLDFRLWSPVFNVADVGVCCGCALMILGVFLAEPKYKKRDRGEQDDEERGNEYNEW
ncbi:MAG: signal peptidase II [Clostridiales bacterium]|nr:signal peptidase II [Clostridiales bacterium]